MKVCGQDDGWRQEEEEEQSAIEDNKDNKTLVDNDDNKGTGVAINDKANNDLVNSDNKWQLLRLTMGEGATRTNS